MKEVVLDTDAAYVIHQIMGRIHPTARIIRAIPIREEGKAKTRVLFVEK